MFNFIYLLFILKILLFIIFSSIFLTCFFCVFVVENPIYSILFLLLVFANLVGFFFLYELEFFAILFLLIYLGVIIVFFVYVFFIMSSYSIDYDSIYSYNYYPLILAIIFSIVFIGSCNVFSNNFYILNTTNFQFNPLIFVFFNQVTILGFAFFSQFSLHFLMLGLIMFIAMFGVSVLGYSYTDIYKTRFQDSDLQILRSSEGVLKKHWRYNWMPHKEAAKRYPYFTYNWLD